MYIAQERMSNDNTHNNEDDENETPAIQQIAPSSVQRLVAGQAITDLSSAVKELVDNAIDAGATRIHIKLYDQGLEGIEVSDNGGGVPSTSRPMMAMKHATSKLRNFDDLYSQTTTAASDGDSGCNYNNNSDGACDTTCAPTLGFRGEALFCLANISRSLTVSTRTSNEQNLGEQFAFNTEGQLISNSITKLPRSIGTTVTVKGLFESLPVRRVDLCKRIKPQRMKLMKMMQGYAILCLGTQFNLTDVQSSANSKDKSKSKIATSESSKTLEARTASILGTKFLAGLTRMNIDLSNAVKSSEESTNNSKWKVQGLISHAPSSPHPTNARDLQFFSINGRPVDLPSVSRVLGDVWRLFDPTAETKGGGASSSSAGRKRCACVLAFTLPNNMYDVNLSPDKREVLFTEETAMSDLIRNGLMELWSSQSEGKFNANEVESRSNMKSKSSSNSGKNTNTLKAKDDDDDIDNVTPKLRRRNTDEGSLVTHSNPKRPKEANNSRTDMNNGPPSVSQPEEGTQQTKEKSVPTQDRDKTTISQSQHLEEETTPQENQERTQRTWSQMKLPERAREQDRRGWEQMQLNFQRVEKTQLQQDMNRMLSSDDDDDMEEKVSKQSTTISSKPSSSTNKSTSRTRQPKRQKRYDASFLDGFAFGTAKSSATAAAANSEEDMVSEDEHQSDNEESATINVREIINNSRRASSRQRERGSSDNSTSRGNAARMVAGRTMQSEGGRTALPTRGTKAPQPMLSSDEEDDDDDNVQSDDSTDGSETKRVIPIEAEWGSFSGTQSVISQYKDARLMMKKNRKILQSSKRKRTSSDEDDSNNIDVETTVNLCKEDFLHMSIIGQFNLGFILARCRNNNLWILDQHACDEKYNFERLCKETVIHEQKLIAPLALELSPSEEHTVLEHMDVFERNGFRFSYDPEKEPRHRLSLTALPHSGSGADGKKAVQFGKEDVGALCAMLGADGISSSQGYIAGFDTGTGGGRIAGVNAVRRYAGMSGGSSADGIVGSSIIRLPKAIAMFASRACRSSIMIGTALSHKEQLNILKKLDMSDIPWNCAHGRPTMSHIRSLVKCLREDDDANALHVAGPSLSVL